MSGLFQLSFQLLGSKWRGFKILIVLCVLLPDIPSSTLELPMFAYINMILFSWRGTERQRGFMSPLVFGFIGWSSVAEHLVTDACARQGLFEKVQLLDVVKSFDYNGKFS